MQDVQNIPNPDVDSFEIEGELGSHSDVPPNSRTNEDSQNSDVENPGKDIPVPPDTQSQVVIEEPPEERDREPIEDNGSAEPKRLV